MNLQPSYFCSGDQDLGWDLMDEHGDIRSVRIEIEPFSFGEVATTREDAKRWIDEADGRGYDVVATYHHYPDNGSADPQAVQNAADFWAEHYAFLSEDSEFTINLMNEWGNHQVSAGDYAAAYDPAIQTVRSQTSYTGSIVVDAPGWGQETHRLAEATDQLGDDDLILSAHVYGDGWNQAVDENLRPAHLDVLDETDYPCVIGEFGSRRPGNVDWAAVVDHANDLGWPVFAWAWNGDGSENPMNLSSPYWGNDCGADSYQTTPYFEEIYPKLGSGGAGPGGTGTGGSGTGSGGTGGSGNDTTPPSPPSNLASTGQTATTVDLTWTAGGDPGGSGLAHYNVYVDGSVDHSVSAGETGATVSDLVAGTSYEFAVSAVDGAGNESNLSAAVTVTTGGGGDSAASDDTTGGWWGTGETGTASGSGGSGSESGGWLGDDSGGWW